MSITKQVNRIFDCIRYYIANDKYYSYGLTYDVKSQYTYLRDIHIRESHSKLILIFAHDYKNYRLHVNRNKIELIESTHGLWQEIKNDKLVYHAARALYKCNIL